VIEPMVRRSSDIVNRATNSLPMLPARAGWQPGCAAGAGRPEGRPWIAAERTELPGCAR